MSDDFQTVLDNLTNQLPNLDDRVLLKKLILTSTL